MSLIPIVLLVFALVLFAIAAFWVPEPPRLRMVAGGLAFLAAYFLATHLGH